MRQWHKKLEFFSTSDSFPLIVSHLLLKEYYEIVGESLPLSAFFTTHADRFTEMHFYSSNPPKFLSDSSPINCYTIDV